jgi:hypothetical protein
MGYGLVATTPSKLRQFPNSKIDRANGICERAKIMAAIKAKTARPATSFLINRAIAVGAFGRYPI